VLVFVPKKFEVRTKNITSSRDFSAILPLIESSALGPSDFQLLGGIRSVKLFSVALRRIFKTNGDINLLLKCMSSILPRNRPGRANSSFISLCLIL
jgi:hypothetical protein